MLRQALAVRFGNTSLLWAGLTFGLIGVIAASSVRRNPMFLLLGVALLLRLMLVFSGGQFYWPDEGRFEDARETAQALAAGRLRDAFDQVAGAGPLFRLIALVPAGLELLIGESPIVPGVFFAVFSVINIWLSNRVARRLGASEREAVLAAALMAMSSSLFYFARHLVPYDVALTFGLLALHAGATPGSRARSSILCGSLAACTFLTYAGYWTFAVAVLIVHSGVADDPRALLKRGLQAGLGFALTLGLVALTSTALGGRVIEDSIAYSQTVTQGSFEEGWRLPWEYLWHSEHLLLVAWLVSVIWGLHREFTTGGSPRSRAGLMGVASIYLMLVISSTVLELFVVYGRGARQLVPFLCLLTGAALDTAFASRSATVPGWARAAVLALLVQAAMNFLAPLGQSFPAEFIRDARRDERYAPGVLLVHTRHFYPTPEPVALPARYATLKEASHPLQFQPYQYEGLTAAERGALRATDISMRMVVPLSR